MTQVSELAKAWHKTAKEIDREDVPWERMNHLNSERWVLGEKLLTAPSATLEDISIKLKWLTDQDLDRLRVKNALRCILDDLNQFRRH